MIWYPYEQMKTMRPPYEIIDAKGVYLYTKDQQLILPTPAYERHPYFQI